MATGAGLAITNDFLLSTASVMIGAPEDLFDLNPAEHAIGLVKNVTLSAEPSYTELQQGVKGSTVFSVLTANPVKASMEVFEYTAKNLSYALGLDATGVAPFTAETTVGTIVAASPAVSVLPVVSATGFLAGNTILIQRDGGDDFVIRKIVSIASNNITVDAPLPSLAVGAKVSKVNAVDIGSKADQPFLAAKIAGKLANGEPIVILIPKLRITKGFNMAFTSDNYGNMPFEFTVYDLVSTDANFAYFGGAQARLFHK